MEAVEKRIGMRIHSACLSPEIRVALYPGDGGFEAVHRNTTCAARHQNAGKESVCENK